MNNLMPPQAYGYARVSTKEQAQAITGAQHGASIEAQTETITRYHAYKLAPLNVPLAQVFVEPGVSAECPIASRPVGSILAGVLNRGDHVIFAKMDRGFRDTADLAWTLKTWTQRGITLHVLDLNLDSSTPSGQMILHVLAAVAQHENERRRQRILDANQIRRKLGLPVGQKAPYGYRIHKSKNAEGKVERTLVPDPDDPRRAIAKICMALKEKHGWSWDRIYWFLIQKKVVRPNGKEYSRTAIRNYMVRELRLQAREAEEGPTGNGEPTQP
jgi:DNA invertase Pin-like site-specific DNA recombinase